MTGRSYVDAVAGEFTLAEQMQLAAGMTLAFEPNCVFDGKLARLLHA